MNMMLVERFFLLLVMQDVVLPQMVQVSVAICQLGSIFVDAAVLVRFKIIVLKNITNQIHENHSKCHNISKNVS